MSILVFDFDSTLVSVEGLDELFARSLDGAGDRERRIAAFRAVTDQGMAGELSAEESLVHRLELLDVDRELVLQVGEEIRDRMSPSVAKHLDFFRANPARIHVVSGGFQELISPTMDAMGLSPDHLHAHRFRFDTEGRVQGLDPDTPMARGGKPAVLRELGFDAPRVWMVGDGATDLEVRELGLAGRFVAYTENRHREPVVERADHVVRSMDELFSLLETQ